MKELPFRLGTGGGTGAVKVGVGKLGGGMNTGGCPAPPNPFQDKPIVGIFDTGALVIVDEIGVAGLVVVRDPEVVIGGGIATGVIEVGTTDDGVTDGVAPEDVSVSTSISTSHAKLLDSAVSRDSDDLIDCSIKDSSDFFGPGVAPGAGAAVVAAVVACSNVFSGVCSGARGCSCFGEKF